MFVLLIVVVDQEDGVLANVVTAHELNPFSDHSLPA
jgi:hypothetical protein